MEAHRRATWESTTRHLGKSSASRSLRLLRVVNSWQQAAVLSPLARDSTHLHPDEIYATLRSDIRVVLLSQEGQSREPCSRALPQKGRQMMTFEYCGYTYEDDGTPLLPPDCSDDFPCYPPHPFRGDAFWQFAYGVPVLHDCPPGLVYDPHVQPGPVCVWPQDYHYTPYKPDEPD